MTVDQISSNSILVLWSAPAEPISQYEVFVNQMSKNIQTLQTTTTEAAVRGLKTGETYSIFIVAIGTRPNSLPSQQTNNTTITIGIFTQLHMYSNPHNDRVVYHLRIHKLLLLQFVVVDQHFYSSSTTTIPERTVEASAASVYSSPQFIAVTVSCGGLLLICFAINVAVIGFAVQTWRKAKRVINAKYVITN